MKEITSVDPSTTPLSSIVSKPSNNFSYKQKSIWKHVLSTVSENDFSLTCRMREWYLWVWRNTENLLVFADTRYRRTHNWKAREPKRSTEEQKPKMRRKKAIYKCFFFLVSALFAAAWYQTTSSTIAIRLSFHRCKTLADRLPNWFCLTITMQFSNAMTWSLLFY